MLIEAKDEGFARRAFTRFLLSFHHRREVRWERGDEPPDYLLSCSGQTFAVEVTQVMTGIDLPTGETSSWQQAQLREFARRLQMKASAEGVLRGAYVVHLNVRDDLIRLLSQAEPEFLEYIRATASDEVHEEQRFRLRGGPIWSIEKYGSHRNLVAPIMSFGARWGAEGRQELERLVRNRIDAKSTRLRGAIAPILLLIDAYHFAEAADWVSVARAVDASSLHTLARVHGVYECQVLASRNPNWARMRLKDKMAPVG